MAMYIYERLCRAYVRLCTAMYRHAWLWTAIYGYVRSCMAMYGMVRLFKAMQGYVELMNG